MDNATTVVCFAVAGKRNCKGIRSGYLLSAKGDVCLLWPPLVAADPHSKVNPKRNAYETDQGGTQRQLAGNRSTSLVKAGQDDWEYGTGHSCLHNQNMIECRWPGIEVDEGAKE